MTNGNITYVENISMELIHNNEWITPATYIFFCVLVILCLLLYLLPQNTKNKLSSAKNSTFLYFQRKYFLVYFLALYGDWLQGPYVYKLYSHYGFVESQIAALYVVGFGASMLFGTGIGTLADSFGRKRMCIAFSILYSLCCITKISSNYFMLMIGRLLGGISTSLLFSTFESWYVHEHIQRYDFPKEWISVTFFKATFWNGVLAIFAGITANVTTETMGLGPVSPFITAIPFLLLSGIIICKTWQENYGERRGSSKACMEGLRLILFNDKILLLGFVQSMFESVMYVFVFLWTPILDVAKPPLGMVFSVFMLCIMIGSLSYHILTTHQILPHKLLMLSLFIAFFAMIACVIATDPMNPNLFLSYIAFLAMEYSVGMYFPSIAYLKSQLIPESHRANIMNWFRVPLNLITCAVLLWLHNKENTHGNRIIFAICATMMFMANCVIMHFHRIASQDNTLYQNKDEINFL